MPISSSTGKAPPPSGSQSANLETQGANRSHTRSPLLAKPRLMQINAAATWVRYVNSLEPNIAPTAPALSAATFGDLSHTGLWRRAFVMLDSPAAIASKVAESLTAAASQGRTQRRPVMAPPARLKTLAVDNRTAPQHRADDAFRPERRT
jgi:hypothetical protein